MILLFLAFLANGETKQPSISEQLLKNESAIYQAIDEFKLAKKNHASKAVQDQLQDVIIDLMEQHQRLEKKLP